MGQSRRRLAILTPRDRARAGTPLQATIHAARPWLTRSVINKSCATGELTLLPNLMRDLADGTVLKPLPADKEERRTLQILNPADYPTDLPPGA